MAIWLFAAAILLADPPERSAVAAMLAVGRPVDEAYRREFALCDTEAKFRGHDLGARNCRDDANNVTSLTRLTGGAIAFVSKLAVDLDGSPFACGPDHGRMDQCPTSLMLPGPAGEDVPVDADAIPYVVIPAAGPPDVRGEFSRLTGVGVGDFGVVIANGRTIPVIVADTGPYAKLGEGSLALHRALGREPCAARDAQGVCRRMVEPMESIGGNVTTILFPGSARADLTPATIAGVVRREGLRLWGEAQRRDLAAGRSRECTSARR